MGVPSGRAAAIAGSVGAVRRGVLLGHDSRNAERRGDTGKPGRDGARPGGGLLVHIVTAREACLRVDDHQERVVALEKGHGPGL